MNTTKKILIGEDEKPMAKALELKLSSAGFGVDVSNDGQDVLDKMEKNTYDLLFLDLIMPEKDGFTVLEELKKRKDKTPVVVLSNLSQEEDQKRAEKLGARGFFIKSNTPIAEITSLAQELLF